MITKFKFLGLSHSINSDGDTETTSSYAIFSDQNTEELAYSDAVQWSGDVGDYFRFPDFDNGDTHTYDDLKVTEIKIKSLSNNFAYQVDFIHSQTTENVLEKWIEDEISEECFDPDDPTKLILVSKKATKSIDKNSVETITFEYEYYGDSTQFALTKVGDSIEIEDNSYICRKYTIISYSKYHFKITIEGVISTLNFHLLDTQYDEKNYEKNLKYFIEYIYIDDFLATLKLNETHTLVEEEYLLNSIKDVDYNDFGVYVSLNFREVTTRMLYCHREEYISNFINGELPNPTIIYHSLWQVKSDDLADFENISGTTPNWTSSDSIITKVIPKRISDVEYEIEIEAQDINNPELYKAYGFEAYVSLANRKDYKIRSSFIHLKAQDCGYVLHKDGRFRELSDWDSVAKCPFITTACLSTNLVNTNLCVLEISESRYYRDSTDTHIERAVTWLSNRVFTGQLAHYEGSFLKHSISSVEVFDNIGRKWTKFTYVYLLAPHSFSWNDVYWVNKG